MLGKLPLVQRNYKDCPLESQASLDNLIPVSATQGMTGLLPINQLTPHVPCELPAYRTMRVYTPTLCLNHTLDIPDKSQRLIVIVDHSNYSGNPVSAANEADTTGILRQKRLVYAVKIACRAS